MKKKIIAIVIALLMILSVTVGSAGDIYSVYVLCKTYVNARVEPTKKSVSVGMIDCGMEFKTDGVTKNGWLHLVDTGFESLDAWVKKGYITEEEPIKYEKPKTYVVVAKKQVAARRSVNGKFIRWLKNGETVKVYSISDWAVTNKGYVMSEFLEVSGDD